MNNLRDCRSRSPSRHPSPIVCRRLKKLDSTCRKLDKNPFINPLTNRHISPVAYNSKYQQLKRKCDKTRGDKTEFPNVLSTLNITGYDPEKLAQRVKDMLLPQVTAMNCVNELPASTRRIVTLKPVGSKEQYCFDYESISNYIRKQQQDKKPVVNPFNTTHIFTTQEIAAILQTNVKKRVVFDLSRSPSPIQ